MSAPSPAPASPTPAAPARSRLTPARLLGAVALAAVGFGAVWQGFGRAGFGTDVHALRVIAACAPLFAVGLVVVWPGMRLPVRAAVALLGLGAASYAWWTVPSSNAVWALSLREAVAERDHYRSQFATATFDNFDEHQGLRGINRVVDQYPALARGLGAEYGEWKDRMWKDIRGRYERAPHDDLKAALALRAATKRLTEIHPPAGELLADTEREWVSAAARERAAELVKLHGDWDGFERTAPGRHALAEAFPETRAELSAAEEEWAEVTAVGMVWFQNRAASPNERPRVDWRAQEKAVLALKSIDTGPDRFTRTRRELFAFAHDTARADVAAHLEAGRYEQAFGLARKHAVEWNATATALGASEVKKLDELRAQCESLARLYDVSAKPTDPAEIAPPPRTKPEE